MKTLAVPAALPRSEAGTRANIAANTAGVRNATPTASTAEPTSRLHAAGTAAARANPTVQAARPPAARRIGGSRSGSVAKRSRQLTTTVP
jgi:hypothetical protein